MTDRIAMLALFGILAVVVLGIAAAIVFDNVENRRHETQMIQQGYAECAVLGPDGAASIWITPEDCADRQGRRNKQQEER